MDRYDRNRQIPNWDQARLTNARVLVVGRDWAGTFAVWALASMGVGEILWLGTPPEPPCYLANWFLADPCPFGGCHIWDYPFDLEYGSELGWVIANGTPDAVAHCAEGPMHPALARFAEKHEVPVVLAATSDGGWYGKAAANSQLAQDPVIAMVAGALVADAVREHLIPLRERVPAPGPLGLRMPEPKRHGRILLVGAGGVGVYVATLAVALGYSLTVVDFDQVETTNLNRQGLFTADDVARGAYKAEAAAGALARMFPGADVRHIVCRVGPDFAPRLREAAPSVLVSAVDNAATRLVLQTLGREAGLVVVQAGTDVFLADVYTQDRDGPTLDEQMQGALTRTAESEAARRTGGCAGEPSYVVPGMIAGALAALRMAQAVELYKGLTPLHWRSGFLPAEEQRDYHDVLDMAQVAP